ncbi:MAG: hypothetical protein PHD48_07245 [Alphaproteobacteria bacterium]|nr:hypothetical protein [Alphaproteobacteria bacterium]
MIRQLAFRFRPFLIVMAGLVFFAIGFFPGFVSPDTLIQYDEAQTHLFKDWHPPVMAWLWSWLNMIWNGPQSVLLFHLALLFSGVYVWRRNYNNVRYASLFLGIAFLPWIVNFSGVIWKDVGLAFSLLLAVGLLAGQKQTAVKTGVALLLLTYAFMVRGNAPAAVAPLLWYLSTKLFPTRSLKMKSASTAVLLGVMVLFTSFFNYHVLNAEKQHPTSYVMIDDLTHLSVTTDQNYLPWVDLETTQFCSQQIIAEGKLVGRAFCQSEKPFYEILSKVPYDELKASWLTAVTTHPFAYITFRLRAFFYLLRSPFEAPYSYMFFAIYPNEAGWAPLCPPLVSIIKTYVRGAAFLAPFLFKPYWWLLVALVFMGATFRMQGHKDTIHLIRVLLSSALLYIFSYIPVTPAADFRYIYWSTIAITLAAMIVLVSYYQVKQTDKTTPYSQDKGQL